MAFTLQSGALGIAIVDWAQAGRLGLSKFVSLGNKADVDEVDFLRASRRPCGQANYTAGST
jgi:acyl-CoA synthetase (NDP forming)